MRAVATRTGREMPGDRGLIGIVIVANGNLARELLAVVEQIFGEGNGVAAVSIEADHDREAKKQEICNAAARVDSGDGVIVVTDAFGSSPANLSVGACMPQNHEILCGANMPMLIKLMQSRDRGLKEASDLAIEWGQKCILKAQAGA